MNANENYVIQVELTSGCHLKVVCRFVEISNGSFDFDLHNIIRISLYFTNCFPEPDTIDLYYIYIYNLNT